MAPKALNAEMRGLRGGAGRRRCGEGEGPW